VLSAQHIELARSAGLLVVLPTALTTRAVACAFAGRLDDADRLLRELQLLTETMEIPMPSYGPLFVAGWRGREAPAMALIAKAVEDNTARGEGAALAFADYARAVLGNGRGRYEDALAAASAIDSFTTDGLVIATAGLAELVEAAARAGDVDRAREALERLGEATRAAGTDWAAGIEARSQALVTRGGAAEDHYVAAIAALARTRIRPQLARTHLLYGEWLRRENRRVAAREQLRVAYDMFGGMGMEAFAARTRRELLATGETVRKRTVATITELTAQEAHIARLAVEGHTNPEIGAQMFISARTVEWHLRKVFTKLGIGSRRELRSALARHGELGALV
jgi:DNA-binding CsgD family transcriptional regulator